MNPYLIIALIAAWLASLVGVGYWQNDAGHVDERSAWQARENDELQQANTTITRLNTEAREKEAIHAQQLADVSTNYQKEIQHAKDQRNRDVAAARSGALVLRYDVAGQATDTSGAGAPGASTGRCDGQAGAELPREISANLLDLVNDADDVTRQLDACQQIVRADRALR